MEKELNIAAILKEKPKGIKLYDELHNIYVHLDDVVTSIEETVIWCNGKKGNNDNDSLFSYSKFGTERGWLDGLQILKPSKEMRDWSKFTWKKGDVLFDEKNDTYCFFDHFIDDEYLNICGKYLYNNLEDTIINDGFINDMESDFEKVSGDDAEAIILNIERKLGGKLNLETLDIEQPKPEFKDGDIVVLDKNKINYEVKCILILKNVQGNKIEHYAFMNLFCNFLQLDGYCIDGRVPRPATDSEKQLLFDALAKEGKHWNPDTLQIEDLPKKCGFKPMDWCLMRMHKCIWRLCQYSSKSDTLSCSHIAVGGNAYEECIPYNNQTKHLLGTTDEWKGGEG